jgi:parvulin-like peptidyl-prolyl isomerase
MSETFTGTITNDRRAAARFANPEPRSNEIDESESQYEKQSEQRVRTSRGIVIDLREEQNENALDSIHVNSESVSSEINESDLQNKKHSEQTIRTRNCGRYDLRAPKHVAADLGDVQRRRERGNDDVAGRAHT